MPIACDAPTLVANSACYQCQISDGMKLPVLIALGVQIAGVNPDPAYLVSQAACLECSIPPSMELPALIALACNILIGTTSCINLIPAGTAYDDTGAFTVGPLLQPNTTYTVIFGPNDTDLANAGGTPTVINGPGQFQFTTGNSIQVARVSLDGPPDSLITATLCLI
jgi:hypothetical protein